VRQSFSNPQPTWKMRHTELLIRRSTACAKCSSAFTGVEDKDRIMLSDFGQWHSVSRDGAMMDLRSVGRTCCWRSAVVILHARDLRFLKKLVVQNNPRIGQWQQRIILPGACSARPGSVDCLVRDRVGVGATGPSGPNRALAKRRAGTTSDGRSELIRRCRLVANSQDRPQGAQIVRPT
jgi:hypothetical protein